MRRTLFYIIAAVALCACKPTPEQLAKRFILERAVDPSSMRILYHSEVLRPERTKQDTMYYIAALLPDTAISDSIRIETRHFPEHYYCYWTIEGNDSASQPCRCNIELAVFPDGEVMYYEKYRSTYYGATAINTRAQRDTLTGIRTPGFYKDADVWALKQMLMVTNR